MNAARTHLDRTKGLTLIELLAALVVLSLFVTIAGGWLVSSTRTVATIETEADHGVASARAMAYLLDDLDAADPASIKFDAGSIAMITLNPAPGSSAGWRLVRWESDDAGMLSRTAMDTTGNSQRTTPASIAPDAALEVEPLDASSPPTLHLRLRVAADESSAVWEPLR